MTTTPNKIIKSMHTRRLTTINTRQLQHYTQDNYNNTHNTTTIHKTQLTTLHKHRTIQLYKSDNTQRCSLSQTKPQETSQFFHTKFREKQTNANHTKRQFPLKEPEISKVVKLNPAVNRYCNNSNELHNIGPHTMDGRGWSSFLRDVWRAACG